jgi:choline dehydrogenase
MPVIPNEWKDADQTPLDFIVVGAGAGGAPLAARLVERGYTVLMVEMGPEKPAPLEGAGVENTEVPLLHSETTEDARHSLRFFVKHFDEDPSGSQDPKLYRPPNGSADDQGIFYPRAQGVGGCTVHNAMITLCGPPEDWDEIAAATGDESWQGERMRAYFERLEKCHYATPSRWRRFLGVLGFSTGWENSRHGYRGWLDTTLSDLRFLKADLGLLRVVLDSVLAALQTSVVQLGALARALFSGQILPSLDPNNWETIRNGEEGPKHIPCAITPGGERSGPRDRLLRTKAHPAHGKRLHLLTGVFVTEVLLQRQEGDGLIGGRQAEWRATGIQCLPREHVYEADPNSAPLTGDGWRGAVEAIRCRREVILCGGSFNTPQLLMLSGIGPRAHIEDRAINPQGRIVCRVDLPGVGQNLQDRYEVPIVATVTDRFRSLDGLRLSSQSIDPELQKWIDRAKRPAFSRGLYATNAGLISVLVRSHEEASLPDLFIFALAGNFPGYFVGWSKPGCLVGLRRSESTGGAGSAPYQLRSDAPSDKAGAAPHRKLTWLILKARTRQHAGEVRLQSDSPFRRPMINFRSFPLAPDRELEPPAPGGPFPVSQDQDLEALHEGVLFVQKILKIGREKGTIKAEECPGFEGFKGNMRKWIKHTAWGHHACGTCRIGTDAEAVLDSRFRVRGVKELRVVDASVFPRIPRFFIVTNVYMVAEKAADVLSEDHPLPAKAIPREAREALRLDPVLPSGPVNKSQAP